MGGLRASADLFVRGCFHRREFAHVSFLVGARKVCDGWRPGDGPVLSVFYHLVCFWLLGRIGVGILGEEGWCGVAGGFLFGLHPLRPIWQLEGVQCGVEV